MILAIKIFFRSLLIPFLYFGTIWALLVTIFAKIEIGLLLLVFFLPQPNIHYKLHSYPYGWMVIDLLILSICLGFLLQKSNRQPTGNEFWILILLVVSYLSLWEASINFTLPMPIFLESSQFVMWKNYARVVLLYFVVVKTVQDEQTHKKLVILITLVILFVALKSYRSFSGGASFSYDKRYGGPFELAGLGANHFGAFIAAYSAVPLGLLLQDDDPKRRYLYLLTLVFCLHPLFYTYSRGAYLGMLVSLLFFGFVREKKILIMLLLLFCFWQIILPASVIDRVQMTQGESGELENSAAGRFQLWDMAYDLFYKNPIRGVGFNGFALTVERDTKQIISDGIVLTDTHNYFVKVLCEQGVLGMFVLLIIFARAFKSGWKLYKRSKVPFVKGLGLGFSGCIVSLLVVNCFGDRFSYLECGGYFWILWALVDRGFDLTSTSKNLRVPAVNNKFSTTVETYFSTENANENHR